MPSVSRERKERQEKERQATNVAGLEAEIVELRKLNGVLKGQLTKANKKIDELGAHTAELTDQLEKATSARKK